MGVTLIVGVIALASTTVARLELRGAVARGDMRQARVLAQSGVEYGLNWVRNHTTWRLTLTSGQESTPIDYDGGTITWSVTDADGDLTDNPADAITLRGVGRVGGLRAVEEVTLQAGGDGISCLEAALHCNSLWDANGNTITTDGQVSSNGTIDVLGSSHIAGDAWATGEVWNPSNVSGAVTDFQATPRVMPTADAFDYYKTNGTWIPITAIPESFGTRSLALRLISPASNPFGETNPEGIYVIDCQGQDFSISLSRIVGTLVILNPGSNSKITGENTWDPAVANYPALLVDGHMEFDMQGLFNNSNLIESMLTPNYNPAHTPYQGVSNTTKTDSYPSEIRGLVYVAGIMHITDGSYFAGSVICGGLLLDDNATFNYSSTFLNFPPPGFGSGTTMDILPGSWKRAAY